MNDRRANVRAEHLACSRATMMLYHCTTVEAAHVIMRDGFRDAEGSYLTQKTSRGVWLSDRPLDCNEGAEGDTILTVSFSCTEADLADFEWIEEGKPYREWLIPSSFIQKYGTVERTS